MCTGVQRCHLQNIPTHTAKSKARKARHSVPAPVVVEPLMGTQSAVATTYSTLESSADTDVTDWATDSADADTDEGVPASKRARFDGPHPVSFHSVLLQN